MQKIATAPARFAVMADKRGTLDLALDHLIAQAPLAASARPEAIALPAPAAPSARSRWTRTAARCA
jgi:hypothetical protein